MTTEGIILKVEALGRVQKQPVMHDGPIATWRNGDPIALIVVSDVDADAAEDDLVALDQPLFLPLDLDAIEDVDVATVAPLRVLLADVGAENVPGVAGQGAADQAAADQGVLAPADKEIEGVAYEVIDGDDDDVDNNEVEATEAPRYNLRRQQPPTFESYANPNGIHDVDLDLESSSFDFSINIDDTPDGQMASLHQSFYQGTAEGHVNLTPVLVTERPREHTFEKGDKPRDMDEVRNMSYRFMVTQLMEHEGIAKHGEKAVQALMKEYAQLDEFKVFEPLDSASLSKKEKASSSQEN